MRRRSESRNETLTKAVQIKQDQMTQFEPLKRQIRQIYTVYKLYFSFFDRIEQKILLLVKKRSKSS